MKPVRKQRLAVVLFVLVGAGATVGLVMSAMQENINLFYEPPGSSTAKRRWER